MHPTARKLSAPRVSFLIPVYNAERFLEETLDSVLAQTFSDFEVIAIDDGSTDASSEILATYAANDPRIRLVRQANGGVTKALNRGLQEVRGTYTARIDADDIALPDRLAIQVAWMDTHPECGVLGTAAHRIGPAGETLGTWVPPTDPDLIRWRLTFGNCLIHPTILMRTGALRAIGGYDESVPTAQDYVLWVRLMQQAEIRSIETPTIFKREWDGRVTQALNATSEHVTVSTITEAVRVTTGMVLTQRTAEYLRTIQRPDHWAAPPWSTVFTVDEMIQAYGAVEMAHSVLRRRCRSRASRRLVDANASALLWRVTRGARDGSASPRLVARFASRHPRTFAVLAGDRMLRSLRLDSLSLLSS